MGTRSVTTAPPISEGDADADDGHDRHRGVLQRVHEQDLPSPTPLERAVRTPVLAQHLEHGGARDAGDERHEDEAQAIDGRIRFSSQGQKPLAMGV